MWKMFRFLDYRNFFVEWILRDIYFYLQSGQGFFFDDTGQFGRCFGYDRCSDSIDNQYRYFDLYIGFSLGRKYLYSKLEMYIKYLINIVKELIELYINLCFL